MVEAIQFKRDKFKEVNDFTEGNAFDFRIEKRPNGKSYCEIKTLEGFIAATEGDYIIRGVNKEYYPCKPDIFEKTYERVGD